MSIKILINTDESIPSLGNLPTYTNGLLARIGKKPVISHIIEFYPKDTNFIVALGHYGNHVRDFLLLTYPDCNFEYIEEGRHHESDAQLPEVKKILEKARHEAGSSEDELHKLGEAVFIFDKFVIKFFADEVVVKNRAERGRVLDGFVPHVEGVRGNFFRYRFVPGELYSHVVQLNDFKQFLIWAQNSFWRDEREVDDATFVKVCRSFYLDKTERRIDQFFKANNLEDTDHVINGERVPSLKEVFKMVDFDRLSKGWQSRFHGDFILDNILKTKDGYCLLDWRQDFGGLLYGGDRYYDFAKLNHNLTVNHNVINKNLFTSECDGKNVRVEIMRSGTLVECQVTLFDFLRGHKYDTRKVRFLTALIWLNMAPLHHHPFNLFLYYFGKLHLWQALRQNDIARKLWY